MARSCRPTPAGFKPRSKVRSARARSSASSSGKLPARRIFQVCAWRAKYSSLLAGGGAISTAVASRVGGGTFGLPVVDMIEVSATHPLGERDRDFLRDHAAHRGADQMRRFDAEHIHQADHVERHVVDLVGGLDRDLQETQLEQFDRRQALAAAQLARLADVAIVEPDDAKSACRKLPAEIVVPMDHLGAQPHDQHHRLRIGLAEDFVTKLDTVGVGDLWRLMG